MPNLLQNLKIREVSSVRRGAGKGVKVMLMKMHPDAIDIPAFLKVKPAPADDVPLDKHLERMFEMSAEHGVAPENVAKARTALAKSFAGIEKNVAEPDRQSAVEKSLSQCVDYLVGLVPIEKADAFLANLTSKESDMTPEQIQKAIADGITAATGTLTKSLNDSAAIIAKQGEQLSLLSMSKEHQDYAAQIEDAIVKKSFFEAADEAARAAVIKAFPPKKKAPPFGGKKDDGEDGSDIDKAIAKALENSPIIVELRKENTDLKKRLGETTDAAAVAEFAKKARDLGLPEAHGEVMRKAYSGDAAAMTKHEEMIKGLVTQGATSALFKEFGGTGDANGATAYELIKSKAADMQKAHPKLSIHQARDRVMSDPMNKELVAQHRTEEGARRGMAA